MKYDNSHMVGLLFVGLLLLGSCTGIEDNLDPSVPAAVQFKATKETVAIESGRTTRAGIDNSDPAMNSMDDLANSDKNVLIYGASYDKDGSADWTAGANLFMNGRTGSVEKSNGDYRIDYGTPKYYDPEDDARYDFKLFFPAPTNPSGGLNDPSGVTILAPTTQRPLGLRVNLYRRPDLLKATLSGRSKTDQPLPIKFEHMLTSVKLQIVKDDDPDPSESDPLAQDIYINRLTVSGVIRGTYDIIKEEFETPVKQHADPNQVDAATGASILVPGYNTDDEFLVPAAGEEPKLIREIFLFPVDPTASTARDDLERYFFDIWLNERRYSFVLPERNDADWGGWKPGQRYTYTLKVGKADIYVELGKDPDPIEYEPWNPIDTVPITIGVGGN